MVKHDNIFAKTGSANVLYFVFPCFILFIIQHALVDILGMLRCRAEQVCYRLRAKKGPAPPLGNFADISYLDENFKPHLLRDACTLCSGALVSDSLLHMLL